MNIVIILLATFEHLVLYSIVYIRFTLNHYVGFFCEFVLFVISVIFCPYKVSQLLHAIFDSPSFGSFMWINGIYICCSVPDNWHH